MRLWKRSCIINVCKRHENVAVLNTHVGFIISFVQIVRHVTRDSKDAIGYTRLINCKGQSNLPLRLIAANCGSDPNISPSRAESGAPV